MAWTCAADGDVAGVFAFFCVVVVVVQVRLMYVGVGGILDSLLGSALTSLLGSALNYGGPGCPLIVKVKIWIEEGPMAGPKKLRSGPMKFWIGPIKLTRGQLK